jgi:hypothetical protein
VVIVRQQADGASLRTDNALCFLRLESAAQERRPMTTLGASRLGDDLLVIFDLALHETADS